MNWTLPTHSWFCLLMAFAFACAARASELPVMEGEQRVGTVRYDAAQAGNAAQAAYILAISESVLAARRSLAAMEWPLSRQPTAFVIEVADLGADRLGLTTIDGRVRVTTCERLADPGEDFRPRLKATVAHEYLHLCQYACWSDLTEAREPLFLWWMEACAIWFEHRVAPRDRATGRKMLTYEDAVPEARGAHGRAGLESATAGSSLGYCYAPLAFVLARGYGPKFLARTWLRLADRQHRPLSAVQAIEATLAENAAGPVRSRFDTLFREYALFMMSPRSQFLRDELGLDVLQEEHLAANTGELALPGWSFRVIAPRAGELVAARASAADGLRAYWIGVQGDRESVQRIDGQESLAFSRDSGWLVLVNASPRECRTRVTLGSLAAAVGE